MNASQTTKCMKAKGYILLLISVVCALLVANFLAFTNTLTGQFAFKYRLILPICIAIFLGMRCCQGLKIPLWFRGIIMGFWILHFFSLVVGIAMVEFGIWILVEYFFFNGDPMAPVAAPQILVVGVPLVGVALGVWFVQTVIMKYYLASVVETPLN